VQRKLGVEIAGKEVILCADGEGEGGNQVCVEKWVGHRLYPPPQREEGRVDRGKGEVGVGEGVKEGEEEGEITKFWLWGEETKEAYRLDTVFFQNWYGYQDEVVSSGGAMDLTQVICVSVSLSLFPSFSF
jgi:hypothetical protein